MGKKEVEVFMNERINYWHKRALEQGTDYIGRIFSMICLNTEKELKSTKVGVIARIRD